MKPVEAQKFEQNVEAATDVPVPRSEEARARRAYVAPALAEVGSIDMVTLGTRPLKNPGHGC